MNRYVRTLKVLLDNYIGYPKVPKVTSNAELKRYFRENHEALNLDINADFNAVVIDAIMLLSQDGRLERIDLGTFKILPEQDAFVPDFSEKQVCSAYFCKNRAKYVSPINKKLVYCSERCAK